MVKSQEASSVTNCGLSIHHNSITVLPILYFSQTVWYTLKQKSVSTISLSSVLGYPVVKMLIMHTILKSTTQLQNVCIYDKYYCNAKMYVFGKTLSLSYMDYENNLKLKMGSAVSHGPYKFVPQIRG